MMQINVAVFDDDKHRRESLQVLIDETDEMQCVGMFEDCSDVIEDIQECGANVILMDIGMPNVNGIEGVILLRNSYPDICIIMQTVFEDDDKIVNAISAGANGYILKKTSGKDIIEGIREVMNGGAPMTPRVAKRILELFQKNAVKKASIDYNLTKKEKEILGELVLGYSYKMIAATKEISVYTVNAHIRSIYNKMQVKNVAQAVIKAIQQRVV